jgi:hypothetical protein
MLAWLAMAAGDAWLDGDQLVNLQSLDTLPQGCDPGGELVAHDDGSGDHLIANVAVQVVVDIRATDPHGSDSQEYLARSRRGPGQFLQPQVADAMQA